MLPCLTSYCFHLLQMKAHDETNKTSQARKDYSCIAMQILLVSSVACVVILASFIVEY
jgi:hypothetical protein